MKHRHLLLDPHGLGPVLRDWQRTLKERIAERPFRHSANAGLVVRERVLAARPNALGLSIDVSGPQIWLALIEVASPHNVDTLILAGGQAVLVSAVTGKVIAPVPTAAITATTQALLHTASSALHTLPEVTATPLPAQGRASFYFRVQTVTHGIDIDVADLQAGPFVNGRDSQPVVHAR
jgi:hypothetical protein